MEYFKLKKLLRSTLPGFNLTTPVLPGEVDTTRP
jgi:hypothetical protein